MDIRLLEHAQSHTKEHTFEMVERRHLGIGQVLSYGWWVRLPLGVLCFHHQVLLEKLKKKKKKERKFEGALP